MSWWNYNVKTQCKWQNSQCMRSQLSLTLLLIMNHFEVTQTLEKTVNIKITIEIKVQHKHCTTTSCSLINRVLITYSTVAEKTIWEGFIAEMAVIRAETQTISQSQRKWLQWWHRLSQSHHQHIKARTSSQRLK